MHINSYPFAIFSIHHPEVLKTPCPLLLVVILIQLLHSADKTTLVLAHRKTQKVCFLLLLQLRHMNCLDESLIPWLKYALLQRKSDGSHAGPCENVSALHSVLQKVTCNEDTWL